MNAVAKSVPQDPADILKDAFALALLRQPENPFGAARMVFGDDTMRAMQAATEWPSDIGVLQKMAELLDTLGEDSFLPTKAMLARRIWNKAEAATDTKDALAAYKLFGEVSGHIKRDGGGGSNVNVNVALSNRVMVVRDHGTDEDWEEKTRAQQAKLIVDART